VIRTLINKAPADILGLLEELSLWVFLNVLAKHLNFILREVLKALMRAKVIHQCDTVPVASHPQRVRTLLVESNHFIILIVGHSYILTRQHINHINS
jgi:hypothetical protein